VYPGAAGQLGECPWLFEEVIDRSRAFRCLDYWDIHRAAHSTANGPRLSLRSVYPRSNQAEGGHP
jgi:hypothetical protein